MFPFFIGIFENSRDFLKIFNQANYFLASKLSEQYEDIQDFWEARRIHMKLVKKYTTKTRKKLVILLDGFEQCIYSNNIEDFEWCTTLENEVFFITQIPNMLRTQSSL